MRVGHAIAAALLIASLTTAALSQDSTPPPPGCHKPDEFKVGSTILYDLKDASLVAFHENYRKIYGEPPPIDELLVLAATDPNVVILVLFEGGCAVSLQKAPFEEFMEVYQGRKS